MDNVQNLLNQLAAEARASGAGSFGSFEADASYEVPMFEQFLISQGYSALDARSMARTAAQKPAVRQGILKAMQASGQGIVALAGNQAPGNVLAAANFGITVRRDTANIAGPLPFAIFGSQDYANGYRGVIQGQLTGGTVLTSVRGGEVNSLPNSVVFTYTNGANVDTITVTSNTYPYPALLNSTNVDLLRMSKIRLELSDATQQAQFSQDILTVANSPFGKSSTNRISATAFKSPQQFQAGIVDLDAIVEIDKETGLYSQILGVVGFSITLNSFVEKFYRQNTKGF